MRIHRDRGKPPLDAHKPYDSTHHYNAIGGHACHLRDNVNRYCGGEGADTVGLNTVGIEEALEGGLSVSGIE